MKKITCGGAFATVWMIVINIYYVSSNSCPVFLTLSSLSKHIEKSSVVINWGPDCENPPGWIGLFTSNPAITDVLPVVKVMVNNRTSGIVVTDQRFGKQELPGGWSSDEVLRNTTKRRSSPICFGLYLVSYDSSNKLLTFDCLKIQPKWMHEVNIENVTLKDLFLPGTHCSACYQTKANANNIILKRIGFRQDLDIWAQLVFGIRYLDFSIGFYPSHNGSRNFWVMNEYYRVGWIVPFLRDIRRFVITSEETVFLDFRLFPLGFHNNPEKHGMFLQVLDRELGDLVYRRPHFSEKEKDKQISYYLTISQIRQKGKYILITYDDEASLNDTDLIWAPWKKHSSTFLKHSEIGEFMKNLFSQKHPDSPKNIGWGFYGVQGLQSSFTSDDIYSLPRERADIINPELMTMLGGPWSLRANAVLLDFFTNTNLVDMAIHVNRYKTLQSIGNDSIMLDIQP